MNDDAAGKEGEILVVGLDAADRRTLVESIEKLRPNRHRIHAIEPPLLSESARWLDVSAVVVMAKGGSGADLTPLSKLPEMACGRRGLLILDPSLDALESEALAALLRPMLVFDEAPSGLALGTALDLVLPAGRRKAARDQHRTTPGLLGVSRAIREVTDQVRRIADSRISALILGETGTGKEVVARAIHRESGRRDGPFLAINCGALPEALLESELFGSDRGAFTGANRDRRGFFEQADKGTLFLDEIGEMPASMQVKLLRVLEDGRIRRLGGNQDRQVDVRIISATHRNLEEETAEGRFRQDLLFRLNTASILLPPLRRRPVDIPFLAQHFAEEFGAEHARSISLSEGFLSALCEHDFPGNVRELRNAVERAIALAAPDEAIAVEHLPTNFKREQAWQSAGTLKERIEQLESHVIRESLEHFDGNRTKTAEALGLSRAGLRQKLKRLGLD